MVGKIDGAEFSSPRLEKREEKDEASFFFIQSFLELDRLTRKINNETKARGEIKRKGHTRYIRVTFR